MRKLLVVISFAGLGLVIVPVLAYVTGSMSKEAMSNLILAGTLVWFASVPFWMGRDGARGQAG